jgi:hypothetical protein
MPHAPGLNSHYKSIKGQQSAWLRLRISSAVETHTIRNLNKHKKAEICKILEKRALEITDNLAMYDKIDRPGSNATMPASTRPAAIDIYYGVEVGKTDPTRGLVNRYAYASGSGANSIRPDPKDLKIHLMGPDLVLAAKYLMDHLKTKMDLPATLAFNSVSAKLYYGSSIISQFEELNGLSWSGKHTGLHSDVIYDNNGNAKDERFNSQVPGTPVVICTAFDSRRFIMQLHSRKSANNKTPVHPSLIFEFVLDSGMFIVLVGEDEKPKTRTISGKKQIEKAHWRHKVPHVEKDSLSVSFMFRVVQNIATVHANTGASMLDAAQCRKRIKDGYETHKKKWEQHRTRHLLYNEVKIAGRKRRKHTF